MFVILLLLFWGFIQYLCLYRKFDTFKREAERADLQREAIAMQRRGSLFYKDQYEQLKKNLRRRVSDTQLVIGPGKIMKNHKLIFYANIVGNALLGILFIIVEVLLLGYLDDEAKKRK